MILGSRRRRESLSRRTDARLRLLGDSATCHHMRAAIVDGVDRDQAAVPTVVGRDFRFA